MTTEIIGHIVKAPTRTTIYANATWNGDAVIDVFCARCGIGRVVQVTAEELQHVDPNNNHCLSSSPHSMIRMIQDARCVEVDLGQHICVPPALAQFVYNAIDPSAPQSEQVEAMVTVLARVASGELTPKMPPPTAHELRGHVRPRLVKRSADAQPSPTAAAAVDQESERRGRVIAAIAVATAPRRG